LSLIEEKGPTPPLVYYPIASQMPKAAGTGRKFLIEQKGVT